MTQPSLWPIVGLLLVTGFVYLGYRAYSALLRRLAEERRQTEQASQLQLATIEALALAIDAKDQTARNRIRRVQFLATKLARALGMDDPGVQAVKTAALLHDIGKLAVPDHILAKAGPLTPEEFQKVRIHPQVGAEIIGGVPFPYPVSPLIRSHHERWDGRGYPDGLKGEEIPLGARIIGVVDYFDALTSDRPYHRALSTEAAQALLRQEAGKALDPRAVEQFIALIETLHGETLGPHSSVPALATVERRMREASPAVTDRSSVFDDITHAHREMYALYQIAQTMGTSLGVSDTMALIASKLANLVPFSACALFLYNDATETLHCRFATGIDSELIQQLALRAGQGLTGWVARNRRPLVNARPSADLDAAGSQLTTVLQSALVCPLIVGDRFIGTLAVYHTTPSFYRDDHRRLLDRVCEQAGAVIHNAIVFEQTQEASLTDPLTGLPNTRFMLMHLGRELARAGRAKANVALLVIDLNGFKEINDTYGHHIGDRALREVARTLRGAIRPYDVAVRYAGDEFIVVIPGCGRDEADNKCLELQDAVERIEFEGKPGMAVPLRISAGAAIFPQDGDTYETLLAKADSRMYRNKADIKRGAHRQRSRATALDDLRKSGAAS
jgi:diguanylate cyclase (GGDEF)-like protein/putative nucleotidyltransferase with HDIG domain